MDHRRFWDAMDRLDPEAALRKIETELGRRIVVEFDLDLSGLVLDMTNFATFIDTANDRAPIAQRGKAKQKRLDLRLVGLALVVTRDGAIPAAVARLPRRPARYHPVRLGDRPAGRPRPRTSTRTAGVVDRGLRRRPELGGQPRAGRGVRDRVRRVAATGRPPPPAGHLEHRLPTRGPRQVSGTDLPRHPGPRAGRDPARGADSLTNPARRAVARVRPDPDQGPPTTEQSSRPASPAARPDATGPRSPPRSRRSPSPAGCETSSSPP